MRRKAVVAVQHALDKGMAVKGMAVHERGIISLWQSQES